jgi:hypothetical protein
MYDCIYEVDLALGTINMYVAIPYLQFTHLIVKNKASLYHVIVVLLIACK